MLRPTIVVRVAPPTVVVQPVVYTLQIHTREGMSRLDLEAVRFSVLAGVGSGFPFFRRT